MARYFESMQAVIERHGGSVEKFIGDAVMAVFGVPVVHEDDALRAVRAATEMRDGVAELNGGLARDYGVELELRIGVNTGEVVTGTEERLATGDAVNVAARLEQGAQPGEILLGEATYRLVRDAVRVEDVAPAGREGEVGAARRPPTARGRGGRSRSRSAGRHADGGQAPPAEAARRRLRERGLRALVPPVHGAGLRRGREVAPRGRVPHFRRRRDRCSRALPFLRGGDHLLAGGRSGEAASRRGRDSTSTRSPPAGSARCSGTRRSSPRPRRSRGLFGSCSRRRRSSGRSWSSSTMPTGARRPSSI